MKTISKRSFVTILFLSGLFLISQAQEKKKLDVTDLMKFRQIESPSISNDGKWIVYTASPDRGDPEVYVYSSDGKKKYILPGSERPEIANDGNWVVARQVVPAAEQLNPDKKENSSKPGIILLNTNSGEQKNFSNIQSFEFSNDSKWISYMETKDNGSGRRRGGRDMDNDIRGQDDTEKPIRKKTGSTLHLYSLQEDVDFTYAFVQFYEIDSVSHRLAYVVADSTGAGNGVYIADLKNNPEKSEVVFSSQDAGARYLTWNKRSGDLVFLGGTLNEEEELKEVSLYLWSEDGNEAQPVLTDDQLNEGWCIYHENRLQWSRDGERLFLGTKPLSEIIDSAEEEKDSIIDIYGVDVILEDRGVDVWHWNDPLINSNQKITWNRIKNRTYTGVFFPGNGSFVQLADQKMPDLRFSDSKTNMLGSSNVPYMVENTWVGRINDYYLVDIKSGMKRRILERHRQSVRISPDGKYVAYYQGGNWFLVSSDKLVTTNLTRDLNVPFADEDHDFPSPVPGYGIAGWLENSKAVLIYDKYDIWQFPTDGKEPMCLTNGIGREQKLMFRIRDLDSERQFYQPGENIFLQADHDLKKFTAVYSLQIGKPGVTKLVEEPRKYSLLEMAKNSEKLLYTRETYSEFPDLWTTDMKFKKQTRISDVNPQVNEFAWGEAELVEWTNMDGRAMQGMLIKPGNYKPGKKYPVLVYYYRFMSQRLYEFNQVVVNHRPCFPYYASNGYAVFLPDIRFDVGFPGYSATKCLVPGVQKLIDMGIADPNAIALHGHSWSGYQTALVITQTNMFKCAIAGAPVSNMTSAYSGIRWGSGVARQFQYEQSQSRIGGSLWEYPERYIENSPVFFADRIETPLLIMFGDEDGAVPWYQGIELYLAMRRLEKDCVFLQYRGEPHHPQKYANKLDYTIKFKEYLDHYLKGEPAAEWIEKGVLYDGK